MKNLLRLLPLAQAIQRAPQTARLIFVFTLSLTLFGLSLPCRAADPTAEQPAKLFMWKATNNTGNTVYLLGSMHFAVADIYPLPQPIEDAFAKADTLVVEVDTTKLDLAAMRKKIEETGMYSGGDSLDKHLSDKTNDLLKTFCKENGFPVEALEKMKPWIASITMETLMLQKEGLNPSSGIDLHFLNEAAEKHDKVQELETADFQFDLLAGFPDAVMSLALAHTLEEIPQLHDLVKKVKDAWASGDEAAMEKIVNKLETKDDPGLKAMEKVMVEDRNGPMTDKIAGYLANGHETFVVVGAAHLIGEHGIVHLLKDKGFTVTQVSN